MYRETVQLRHARVTALERGHGPAQKSDARQCAASNCVTKLSRYNPSSTCSAHEGWQDERERQHA